MSRLRPILLAEDDANDVEPVLGTNGYVVKPVDFAEFIAAVGGLGVFRALLDEPPPLAAA